MPMYLFSWDVETVEVRSAFIEADTESAARQAWIDGDFSDEWIGLPMQSKETLHTVEEITDHDKLCCCPQCMNGAA